MGVKVYKVELMIVDCDGIGAECIKEELESTEYASCCISPKVMSCESRDVGKWSVSHPLNLRDLRDAEYRRLFGN